MDNGRYDSSPAVFILFAALVMGAGLSDAAVAQPVTVAPATMPHVATVDERYQSYNVEMAEVIGGAFRKPYAKRGNAARKVRPASDGASSDSAGLQDCEDPNTFEVRSPIDLSNSRLCKLASALGPAYVRVSGTWANTLYFHDSDSPAPANAPQGFKGILTRSKWKNVVEFTHVVNARLTSSFVVSGGVRDGTGVWTTDQARKLLAYTKTIGGEIAAAGYFNEPTMPEYGDGPPGHGAPEHARDFAAFQAFARQATSNTRIAEPASVGEAVLLPALTGKVPSMIKTEYFLSATPRPVFDVFSFHCYGAISIRCAAMRSGAQTTAEAARSEDWLPRADRSYAFYAGLRDRFEPRNPIWVADAACGGNPWAETFLDTFRYLDQHGRLARDGASVAFHNTLTSSEYGLLDQTTFAPRPNYWAALLWRRLMGAKVLDPGPPRPSLLLYPQCLPDHSGGVTVLAIDTSVTDRYAIEIPLEAELHTRG